MYAKRVNIGDSLFHAGGSLRSWQLSHEVSAMRAGVATIDDDLSFLYGQLPDRIRSAAVAVMGKRLRRVVTDISVAAINFLGYVFGSVVVKIFLKISKNICLSQGGYNRRLDGQ